ncbi:MAG: DUF1445 domain-containing protein [Proteobacteria bacterium]|nr:DUF1445 domain-containing protein [Pseudomonadota bacterium]
MNPAAEARLAMRRKEWTGPTKHTVPGYVKCNLVVLPKKDAYDFLLYCQRNPKPCPLIEVTDPGDPEPKMSAPGADLRTDLPKYAIYRNGVREEDRLDIVGLWTEDSVAFLIGSGMTFDDPLERAGVPKTQTWILNTTIETVPAGKFSGSMVVTMRLLTPAQAIIASQLTGRFYLNHGSPIHMGDPMAIGADLGNPIVGTPLKEIPGNLIPVFWGCGVTPQIVALSSKPQLMIAHAPAHAFITDLKADQICLP